MERLPHVVVKAKARVIDFTNVKDRGEYNPRWVEEGDYVATIVSVKDQVSKKKEDGSGGEPMWVYGFQLVDMASAVYPYYCVINEAQAWKIRAIFVAAGFNVGKVKMKADPNKVIGKRVLIALVTEPGTGGFKDKSVINDVLPLNSGDLDADDEDDDEEEEAPVAKTRAKRKPAPPVEDDDEEDEEEEPEPPKRRASTTRRKAKPVVEDDEEEDEEPVKKPARRSAKAPARRGKATVVEPEEDEEDEDDLDEMEVEEI
jgi:hypothetical protein